MNESLKILMVTPSLPFPVTGAEQSDRFYGMILLKNLGFEVKAIVKTTAWQTDEQIRKLREELGIGFLPVAYKYSNRRLGWRDKIKKLILKVKNPLLLDGAALEYDDPEIKSVLVKELTEWKPDFVWFDYTYLWPLYKLAKSLGVKIITRSINFEPYHFLQEDGYKIKNLLKSMPKFLSELITIKKSDLIFAITPKEEKLYKKLGSGLVYTLPLRGLPSCLKADHSLRNTSPLQVFFMGSTYNVAHNRKALEFILKKVAPYMRKNYPGRFEFNIIGRKMPQDYNRYIMDNVKYHHYVEDLDGFLSGMDIALIPSFFGAGMQQKIFEPLCRGIPTITSRRGLAGYPFEHKKEIWLADNLDGFINGLLYLEDITDRKNLSMAGLRKAEQIFSQKSLDKTVITGLEKLLIP